MIVANRSERVGIERVERMPGTAHAKELKRGMNARPWSPTLRIKLSSRNAARERYPESSRKPMQRKRTTTFPTPGIIPSAMRLVRIPGGRFEEVHALKPSTAPEMSSIGSCAQRKIAWNMRPKIPSMIGNPQILLVKIRSSGETTGTSSFEL
jgi:hypothetical protein